ncbi:MAG: GNAT family N-acetyltransferase [Solirubrobacteraceae bacterium]
MPPVPRALVWATDLDVLPIDHRVQRRDDFLVIRSPGNPAHWWGNFLLFDDAPGPGDGARWEQAFATELPEARHRAFGWDRVDGELGDARTELADRGYTLDRSVGLTAAPADVRPHARANREVSVRALDPVAGHEQALWDAVIEVQVAGRDPIHAEGPHREFCCARMRDLRELFAAGRGAWYVALSPDDQVLGSCGVVVTAGRGRFQAVDTAQAHRRRGICSRLIVDAAHQTAHRYGAERLVIAADADYHALGLYESLGFARRERTGQAYLPPAHPR